MKSGRTLQELAAELTRQQESKRDYMADTRSLVMTDKAELEIEGIPNGCGTAGCFPMTERCHVQVAERTGIPASYYRVMQSIAPALLAQNINYWFNKNPEKRMVRTLDQRARAFLSNRYRPLDNYDLAECVLPQVEKMECDIVSCEITEARMYLKVLTKRIHAEVSKGDVVQAGICISNSEIGAGSVRVEPLVYRLVCENGMIANDDAMRKYHIGRSGGNDFEGAREFFRDETKRADDRAFWMKVRDTVAASLDEVKFKRIVEKMQFAKELNFQAEPEKVIEVIAKREGFTESEQKGILRHLLLGGDLSAYGLSNAISRQSQNIENYDRATEFERLGGKVIEMNRSDFDRYVAA